MGILKNHTTKNDRDKLTSEVKSGRIVKLSTGKENENLSKRPSIYRNRSQHNSVHRRDR